MWIYTDVGTYFWTNLSVEKHFDFGFFQGNVDLTWFRKRVWTSNFGIIVLYSKASIHFDLQSITMAIVFWLVGVPICQGSNFDVFSSFRM